MHNQALVPPSQHRLSPLLPSSSHSPNPLCSHLPSSWTILVQIMGNNRIDTHYVIVNKRERGNGQKWRLKKETDKSNPPGMCMVAATLGGSLGGSTVWPRVMFILVTISYKWGRNFKIDPLRNLKFLHVCVGELLTTKREHRSNQLWIHNVNAINFIIRHKKH